MPSNPKVVPPGAGKALNILGDVVTSLVVGADTGGAYAVQQQASQPGGGPPLHRRPLHDSMPVILDAKDYDRWLDPAEQDAKKLAPILVPYQGEDLTAYSISTRVNSPRNQSPQCIEPIGAGRRIDNLG